MKWPNIIIKYNPLMIRWETTTARFIQIEFSPSHIFRIKMDKKYNKKEGGETA